jgi:hypothetical protein
MSLHLPDNGQCIDFPLFTLGQISTKFQNLLAFIPIQRIRILVIHIDPSRYASITEKDKMILLKVLTE